MLEQEIKILSDLESALPEKVPFYHLGEVTLNNEILSSERELIDMEVLGYSFLGDVRGLMLVLFDKGLDSSIYSELGNVIAARTASRLGNEKALDVLISPPKKLSSEQVNKLVDQGSMIIHRTYLHVHKGVTIPVQTWILPHTKAEAGNA
jgi:hypothetical protein